MSRLLAGAVAAVVAVVVAGAHGSSRPTTYSLSNRQALATFAPNPAGSDCDYRRGRVVTFRGRQGVAAWLRSRFADGDYLGIDRVWDGNTESPVGVLAVDWKIRRSATLRRLGFPRGIVPELSAKVVFTQGPRPRIRAFGNGPVGGDPSSCRPR